MKDLMVCTKDSPLFSMTLNFKVSTRFSFVVNESFLVGPMLYIPYTSCIHSIILPPLEKIELRPYYLVVWALATYSRATK